MLIVGILSFVLYWVFVVHILRKWGFDSFQTISDHVAIGDQRRFYNVRAALLISLFMFFVVADLLPKYELGLIAYLMAVFAWVTELFVIYFPRHGRHFVLHDMLTRLVGSSIYLLVALVGLSEKATTVAQIFTVVSLLFIASALIPIVQLKRRKNFIFFQSAFFGGVQIVLLVLGFLST